MRYLLASLLSSAALLAALPTGRYLGSELNTTPHLHNSDDIFVDEDLQALWDAAPSFNHHSLPGLAALNHEQMGKTASSPLVPVSHPAGHQTAYSPPPRHPADTQFVSTSGASSTHEGPRRSSHHLGPPNVHNLPQPSSHYSTPRLAAPDHAHVGHSTPSIEQPTSKRLKKKQAATLPPPPHHHTFAPAVSESSNDATTPTRTPQGSAKPRATRKKLQPAEEWKKAGLPMTEEAHPHDVHASLDMIQSRFTYNREKSLRTSVLSTAMATIADGCTSRHQYLHCMDNKYGKDLVQSHRYALGRIITKKVESKTVSGVENQKEGESRVGQHTNLHTQTADHIGKWFAEDKRAKKEYATLKLVPHNRLEPLMQEGDVDKYGDLINHLDPYQLSTNEFIRQGRLPFEAEPHRWNRHVPRLAMKGNLYSNDASAKMVEHFQTVYTATIKSVSYCPGRLIAPRMALTQDKQNRNRQRRLESIKARAVPPSHPRPH